MDCEVVVLGDIEMGGGTLTDDFIADRSLSQLIQKYSKRKNPVDLILNGDTFDFLKCPYVKDGQKSYPRHINSAISLSKLKLISQAHSRVFDALAGFVKKRKNNLYFIIGNHDHDLFFKEVQKQIRLILNAKRNVFFNLYYKRYGIYTEHGQQYDFLNRINRHKPFISYKNQPILNIPWVALGIISNFLTLKEEHPFLERIFPRPALFSRHREVVKKLSWRSVDYLFKSLVYYPIRYFNDPTYFIPRTIFRELYRRVKKFHWEVDSIVAVFKFKKKLTMKNHKVHVLGHVHENYTEEKNNWVLIHPDTWRDEYRFDAHTRKVIPKLKKYVLVDVINDNVFKWQIVEWPLTRKPFIFTGITSDEVKYLERAARMEGYKFRVPKI